MVFETVITGLQRVYDSFLGFVPPYVPLFLIVGWLCFKFNLPPAVTGTSFMAAIFVCFYLGFIPAYTMALAEICVGLVLAYMLANKV